MPMRLKPQFELPGKKECVADSRSTSAGSRESGDRHGATAGYAASMQHSALPDYEYPVPLIVRNTFIETNVGRPDSLEEFYAERRIHSSPAVPKGEKEETNVDSRQPDLRRSITIGAQSVMSTVTELWKGWHEECPATPTSDLMFQSWSEDTYADPMQMPRVIALSEALPPEPMLGSTEVPTIGSARHHLGTCKPCAFFHTRFCENGVECPFCHLCPPDEKRRRQKEKQAAYREMRRQREQRRQVRF